MSGLTWALIGLTTTVAGIAAGLYFAWRELHSLRNQLTENRELAPDFVQMEAPLSRLEIGTVPQRGGAHGRHEQVIKILRKLLVWTEELRSQPPPEATDSKEES